MNPSIFTHSQLFVYEKKPHIFSVFCALLCFSSFFYCSLGCGCGWMQMKQNLFTGLRKCWTFINFEGCIMSVSAPMITDNIRLDFNDIKL